MFGYLIKEYFPFDLFLFLLFFSAPKVLLCVESLSHPFKWRERRFLSLSKNPLFAKNFGWGKKGLQNFDFNTALRQFYYQK